MAPPTLIPVDEQRWATAADGARIAFDVRGGGEPLVLLPGQANPRRWWDPVRDDFAAVYSTIAIDTLGTGASDAPADAEYSTRRFGADVVAVLDELGIDRAHVYGTSMGGRAAQWVAIDHPSRVGALVLGCTTAGGDLAVDASRETMAPLSQPPAEAREALTRIMVTPAYTGPLTVLGESPMRRHARRAHRRASAGHDAAARLGEITAPTLVLHGTDDPFSPVVNGENLAAAIPGAELRVFEGARHAYFLEFADEATPAVLNFLANHPLP